jgi:hypothetical protein
MFSRIIKSFLGTYPSQRSGIANWAPASRARFRKMKPWGVALHTSGRGITKRAKRLGVPAISLALRWYRDYDQSGVHYVIDHDGTIYQMLEDHVRGAHIGISRSERRAYLSGAWIREVAEKASVSSVVAWQTRWPRIPSPQHLYPTRSPNGCYVGVEMLPLSPEDVGPDGLWFTKAQHESAGALARDIAIRHSWPIGWERSPRLVGHEDIDAYARWDKGGGWDPGAMRANPRWDWDLVMARIALGFAGSLGGPVGQVGPK